MSLSPEEKEKVKAWYKSLKDTLQSEGVDISKTNHLLRVQVLELRESKDRPGDLIEMGHSVEYAFMQRKETSDGSVGPEMQVQAPSFASNNEFKKLENQIDDHDNKVRQRDSSIGRVQMTINQGKQVTGEMLENISKSKEIAEKEHYDLIKKNQEIWKEEDKWALTNQKLFDEESDKELEQIKYLYDKANNGQLFLQGLSDDNQGRKQILVHEDGSCVMGKDYEKFDPNAIQHSTLSESPKKYGVPPLETVSEEMQNITPVEKPGFFSWFKRIISFGIADGDFKRYENYQLQLANLAQETERVKKHNEKAYEEYNKIVEENHKGEYPEGVKDVGKKIAMQAAMQCTMVELKNGTGYEQVDRYRQLNKTKLMIEAIKHPESFKENGERDKEKSEEYYQKDRQAENKFINELEGKTYLLLEMYGKYDNKEKIVGDKLKDHKAADKDFENSTWINRSQSETFKKIGDLFQKDSEYGRNVFFMLCTANNGGNKQEQIASRLSAISKTLQAIDNPESVPNINEIKTELKEKMLDFQPNMNDVFDSLTSITLSAKNMVEGPEKKSILPEQAVCAELLHRLATCKDKNIRFDKNGKEDLSVGKAEERRNALHFAKSISYMKDTVLSNKNSGQSIHKQEGFKKEQSLNNSNNSSKEMIL